VTGVIGAFRSRQNSQILVKLRAMKTLVPTFLIIFLLTCFAFLSKSQAVSPPPDGGYGGGNTAEGTDALFSLTSGIWNTALGAQALNHDNVGGANTATGYQSLFSNLSGGQNTATGALSLFSNLGGQENTATGYQSLFSNTVGKQNTASGAWSLFSNYSGQSNTADGYKALARNVVGHFNTAVGAQALWRNTNGVGNTAVGGQALMDNTFGVVNTAIGGGALSHNTTAERNTGIGANALELNTTGNHNTATGYAACDRNTTGGENTANGHLALYNNVSGSNNLALGARSGSHVITADNVICIGANVAGDDVTNSTWLGNIYGVTTQSGTTAPVVVSDSGQLGTVASSERFKKDIATMDKASETILSLRPVIFRYKTDTKGTPQFGLIAEEVAKVNPALVLPDKEGKPYTVRYDAVNAMLLNEFLKEHQIVQQQQEEIDALKAELREQRGLIQKISEKVEITKPVPQMVSNN
jgi:hypothetical protein